MTEIGIGAILHEPTIDGQKAHDAIVKLWADAVKIVKASYKGTGYNGEYWAVRLGWRIQMLEAAGVDCQILRTAWEKEHEAHYHQGGRLKFRHIPTDL